jgi:hypothetical protein
LTKAEYDSIFETLHAVTPGQNLGRNIRSKSDQILSCGFGDQEHSDGRAKGPTHRGTIVITEGIGIRGGGEMEGYLL